MTTSLSADQIISQAKECYALGLINQPTLEYVTQRAENEPGYNGIDLPAPWDIEYERRLRRRAARRALPWWRRILP